VSWYEFLLFVHIVGAVVWIGGGSVMHIIGRRALASDDGQRIHDVSKEINHIAMRLYPPVSLLLLVAGILLVDEVGADFGDTWIVLGLAGWLFSFVVGVGYYGPQDKRLQALVAERGPTDPGVAANIRAALNVNVVELTILFLVILDMVVKPGL
jgi:uncharacterized membrane protein